MANAPTNRTNDPVRAANTLVTAKMASSPAVAAPMLHRRRIAWPLGDVASRPRP